MAYRRNPPWWTLAMIAVPVAAVGGGAWYFARGRKRNVFAAIKKAIEGKPGAEEITYSDVQGRIPPPVMKPLASDMYDMENMVLTEGWVVSDRLYALLGMRGEASFISLRTARVPTLEAQATQEEIEGPWAVLLRKADVALLRQRIKRRREAPEVMPPTAANMDGLRGIAYRSSVDSAQWTTF